MGQNSYCMQCGEDLPKDKWVKVPAFMTLFQALGHRELFCSDVCFKKFQKEWCV